MQPGSRHPLALTCLSWLAVASGCSAEATVGNADTFDVGTDGSGAPTTPTSASTGAGAITSATSGAEASTGEDEIKLDVLGPGGEPIDPCGVVDGLDGQGSIETAPADSFDPQIQWSWHAPDGAFGSNGLPLVANLTDDNGDGKVDLCDTPDVIAQSFVDPTAQPFAAGTSALFAIDGATGQTLFRFEDVDITSGVERALGDIDGDGMVEVLAYRNFGLIDEVVAFDNDGSLKWVSEPIGRWVSDPDGPGGIGMCLGLADFDADGDPEIHVRDVVFDHEGSVVLDLGQQYGRPSPYCGTAVDLDGDGDLEFVLGPSAYHHDGSEHYHHPEMRQGYSQVADLDRDGSPEIVVTTSDGYDILAADGTRLVSAAIPYGPPNNREYRRPATIHNFSGDPDREFAASVRAVFAVYDDSVNELYSTGVQDLSGSSGSTAFDFLGDGGAEAIYGDESALHVYDDAGVELFTWARQHDTGREYPVVADVDNDGSAEIILTSNMGWGDAPLAEIYPQLPDTGTITVIRDMEDRWVPARRIWNQHAYHVTNVREDGTIPQDQIPHWTTNNTFRTQTQLIVGSTPEG